MNTPLPRNSDSVSFTFIGAPYSKKKTQNIEYRILASYAKRIHLYELDFNTT